MDLLLVRHARPVRIDDAGGPADPELTELGHRQAKAMAEWLAEERFDGLYVSPMVRARQTAAPLEQALQLQAEVVGGVQEYDANEHHYIPMEDLKADKKRWRDFIVEQQQEDMSAFADLVVSSIEDLIARHRGQRIAVICHGGVVNVWAAKVLGMAPTMFFEPHYTSISRFVAASSGERSIQSLNEVAHLRGLAG
ncbi:MAG: histidine phosphatase family protein [Acidimicrobiales bacterium]